MKLFISTVFLLSSTGAFAQMYHPGSYLSPFVSGAKSFSVSNVTPNEEESEELVQLNVKGKLLECEFSDVYPLHSNLLNNATFRFSGKCKNDQYYIWTEIDVEGVEVTVYQQKEKETTPEKIISKSQSVDWDSIL